MDAEWMTIGWDPSLDAGCLLQSNQAKLESIASEQHGTDGETITNTLEVGALVTSIGVKAFYGNRSHGSRPLQSHHAPDH